MFKSRGGVFVQTSPPLNLLYLSILTYIVTKRSKFFIYFVSSSISSTLLFCVFGKNPAMMPSNGRKALTWKMNSILVLSASQPKKAEPRPPRPNIRPKKMPAINPTLSGIRSVAYTTMEENAEAMISPDMKVQMIVHVKFTKGMAMAKGAAPRMENQMTYFLPNLSPSMPHATVPMAKAARNTKRHSCEVCTETPNLSIRKKVK